MHTLQRRLFALFAPVGLTLAVLSAPAAASAYGGPIAVLETAGPNIVGTSTLFVALGTSGGDTRGLTFEYDFDGDGVYDLKTTDAAADYTFEAVGTYKASLRVTDEYLLTDIATIDVVVVEPSVLGAPLFPADGAPPINGVGLSVRTVQAGGKVNLVFEATGESGFDARLVPSGGSDPWLSESIDSFGPFDRAPAVLTISETTPAGEYKVLVVTADQRMTALNLTVVESTPDWIAPAAIGGSVFVVVAIALGTALLIKRRRRLAAPETEVLGR